jgi:hypothetical protein
MADRKQRTRKGPKTRSNLQSQTPGDSLPPTRLHLPKFPPLPKVAPVAGDPEFNTRACGGHFIVSHNTGQEL